MKHSINQKGYHQINLQSVDKKKIGIKITKLVMLHFRFVPGCEYLEVDHLDGNKDNNCLWNMEWVQPRINTRRAIINKREIANNAGYYGENSTLLTFIEAENLYVEAYNLLLDGKSIAPLCEKYNVSAQYIKNIINGSDRPYIRKKYNGKSFTQIYLSDDEYKTVTY